jgi:pilus assembly protein CpaB
MKLTTPRKFKVNRSWIVLGAALGIGLLAALVAYSYLSSQMAAIEARAKGETVPVIVAKHDLPKGARLSAQNVAVRAVPKDFAHSVAVFPAHFDRLEGQALAYPVKGGETILWGLMESKKVPTFSARVEPGRRAMTVPVDEINSISGMLEPGDMIDLIVTVDQKSGDQVAKKITFPLLQSVQVLATGQRSVDDPKSGERRSYSTVTLDTTPEQAQNLIVAREAGKITALLRNPADTRPMSGAYGDVATLLGLRGDAVTQDEKQIPVLYGGSSRKLSADGLNLERYVVAPTAPQSNSVPRDGTAIIVKPDTTAPLKTVSIIDSATARN